MAREDVKQNVMFGLLNIPRTAANGDVATELARKNEISLDQYASLG